MASLAWHANSWRLKDATEVKDKDGNVIEGVARYSRNTPNPDPEKVTFSMVRGNNFEGELELETEDFEANCGQATTLIGTDRVSAESNPSWEQKLIFGEFFEESCYMLLGKKTTNEVSLINEKGEVVNKAYKWTFDKGEYGLPLATIMNSYHTGGGYSMLYNNVKMSTWELAFGDNGANLTVEFGGDAVSPNNPLPNLDTMNLPSVLSKLGTGDFKIYLDDCYQEDGITSKDALFDITNHKPRADIIAGTFNPYDCVTEGSIKFDNNLDDFSCMGGKFGESSKDEGEFTSEGSLTVNWNEASSPLIAKWITGKGNGTQVTTESYYAQVLMIANGKKLGIYKDETGTKDFNEQFILFIPKVEITKAWSPLSGNETKTIDIEYEIVAKNVSDLKNNNSPIHIEMNTSYEKLTNEPWAEA